jgi:purine-binding chemotaxis protein CheW
MFNSMNTDSADGNLHEYVTGIVGGQLFGVPIRRVQDVFIPERLTRVPLAPPEIAGVLNLRGRTVTLIDMRLRLGLDRRDGDAASIAVGVESRNESYGLLVDSVGEVLKFDSSLCERNPINLDPRLAGVSSGIYRMDGQLMVVLDVDRVLDIAMTGIAA